MQDSRLPAICRYKKDKETANIMQIDGVNTTFISRLTAVNAAGGLASDLAALKTRLKALLKLSNDLTNDNSMQADEKKMLLQSLQMQIQMIMQQIAKLEAQGKKGAAAAETGAPPAGQSKTDPAGTGSTPSLNGGIIDTLV
jgi:hypothetical protein